MGLLVRTLRSLPGESTGRQRLQHTHIAVTAGQHKFGELQPPRERCGMENQHGKVSRTPKSSLYQFSVPTIWDEPNPGTAQEQGPVAAAPLGPQLLAQPVPRDGGSKPSTRCDTLVSALPFR